MPQLAGTILVGSIVRPIADGIGLRLYGHSSGYVGLSPANHAGSTTYTLPSADGSAGQALSTNGNGQLAWTSLIVSPGTPSNGQLLIGNGTGYSLAALTAGSNISISNAPGSITIAATSANPGGSNTQIQFNNAGSFGASADLAWNNTQHKLTVNNTVTTSSSEFVIEQNGDQNGSSCCRVQNRADCMGLMIESHNNLRIAELKLKTLVGDQGLVRLAGGSFISPASVCEIQFLPTPTAITMCVGSAETVLLTPLRLEEGMSIGTGTYQGTTIAQSANQKLGFFGATPVTQRAKSNYNNWSNLSDIVQALVDLGLFDQP